MWAKCVCFLILNLTHIITSNSTTSTISFNHTDDNEVYFEPSEIRSIIARNNATTSRQVRYPCQCRLSQCGCCTGNILQNFNINMRQRVCMNVTYDADDFTFGMKASFNDYVFYSNKISGKNPPPACVPIPRITAIKVCGRLTNVYFIGRNIHACMVLEAQWNRETVFGMNFDCFRMGADGFSIVKPEDGGGLPNPIPEGEDNIEEYDELLANQNNTISGNQKPQKPTKVNKTRAFELADFDVVYL